MKRSHLVWASGLVAALLLAFFLRDIISYIVITPLVNSLWRAGHFLLGLNQFIYWVLLVSTITFIGIIAVYGRLHVQPGTKAIQNKPSGPVESMAQQIKLVDHGLYFQWLVANRLGLLAREALLEDAPDPNHAHPLAGLDEPPPEPILAYLEGGLNRTYSQPTAENRLNRRPRPPFNIELAEVIDYLETQMEIKQNES